MVYLVNLVSPGHMVLTHLGVAFVLMLRPFFPELVMSTELLSFEHPSLLLFCFNPIENGVSILEEVLLFLYVFDTQNTNVQGKKTPYFNLLSFI